MFLLIYLIACKSKEDAVFSSGERVAVSFAAGIGMRVTDASWEVGDDVGITMLNSQTTHISGEVFNRRYEVTAPGTVAIFCPEPW